MSASALETSQQEERPLPPSKGTKIIFAAIVWILVAIVVVLVVLLASTRRAEASLPEAAEVEVFVMPDETEYDDASGLALNCTLGEQIWTYDPYFYTIDICDGLYAYGDGFYNGMFLVSSSGVLFVDAPSSMWAALPSIAASVTENPITTVVYSHQHGDHIGGASQLPGIAAANVVCHSGAAEQILARPDMGVLPCTTVLELTADNHTYILQDDDKYVILKYAGYRAHTDNDLFIFAARQRTVMVVDLAFPKWIPWKNLGMATNPDGYLAAHHFLLDNVTSAIYGEWQHLVAGHVDVLGDRADVETNIEYVEDLIDAVHNASLQPDLSFGAVIGRFGGIGNGNQFAVSKAWYDGVAAECARIMNEDYGWAERFQGTAQYSEDNCFWQHIRG